MDILDQTTIAQRLQNLDKAWTAIDNDYLVRVSVQTDFAAAVALLSRIARVADELGHHPDVALSGAKIEFRPSTHSVAGITEKDFALAEAIDYLLSDEVD